MRPLRFIATGASALLVLLFVIAPANAQRVRICQKVFGGSLDVDEIEKNSQGSNVLMSARFEMPSFSIQEILGVGRSDNETASQLSNFLIDNGSGGVSGAPGFAPPIIQTSFSGKASLTWRKYVVGKKRRILSNLRVTYRLLNNGVEVKGFTHVDKTDQVLAIELSPIEPSFLCKIARGGPFIIEGGVNFEIELRELVRSGEHNVSVEVSVDSP